MQTAIHLTRCVLGTAGLGGVWGRVDKKESLQTILTALESGITSIDTAPAYGDAEELIGYAMRQWKGSRPIISTKVGRLKSNSAHDGIYDYSPEGMIKSVEGSLRTLGVDVIDVLFLHEPLAISDRNKLPGIVEQMQEFKRKAYAEKIGIGGNIPEWFLPYTTSGIFDVVMEYNRLDACCQDALSSSLPYCKQRGMEFYAASPLHMGLLGNYFEAYTISPPGWLDKSYIEKAKLLKKIAGKYQMSLQSLAHRFLFSLEHDFKIVIGPSNMHQLCETMDDIRPGALPQHIIEEVMNLTEVN